MTPDPRSACRRFHRILLVGWLTLGPAAAAHGGVLLLDTFEDDTVGLAPGGPEVGSYAPGPTGTHLVAEESGERFLRSSCSAPDGMSRDWFPSQVSLHRAQVRSTVLLESGGTLTGANAFVQAINIRKTDSFLKTVSLAWSDTGTWSVDGGSALGDYSLDTPYEVLWDVDLDASTYRLEINGVELVPTTSLNVDADWLYSLHVACNLGSTLSVRIDDVRGLGDHVFEEDFESSSLAPWSIFSPATLVGDACATPSPLGGGIDAPGTLSGFPADGVDDSSCGNNDTIDRWYAWTAPCTGTATVTTCLPGTEFDTTLAVFDGCGGTELACNDDSSSSGRFDCHAGAGELKSTATFSAFAGDTYPIRVSVYDDDFSSYPGEAFEVRVDCVAGP